MSTSYVQAEHDYGLPVWGEGFFAVNQDGEVCVRLEAKSEQQYSLVKVLEMAKAQGLSLPLLIRFPQLIKNLFLLYKCRYRITILRTNSNFDSFERIIRISLGYCDNGITR